MPNEDKVMQILLQLSQDSAATKQAVETLAQQNSEIFGRMRLLEGYRLTEVGKAQGRRGILGPAMSIGAALASAFGAYVSAKGGHL